MGQGCVDEVSPLFSLCLQVTITDNDLIEKSNLNRQFLFRPHHIQVWLPMATIIPCNESQLYIDSTYVHVHEALYIIYQSYLCVVSGKATLECPNS